MTACCFEHEGCAMGMSTFLRSRRRRNQTRTKEASDGLVHGHLLRYPDPRGTPTAWRDEINLKRSKRHSASGEGRAPATTSNGMRLTDLLLALEDVEPPVVCRLARLRRFIILKYDTVCVRVGLGRQGAGGRRRFRRVVRTKGESETDRSRWHPSTLYAPGVGEIGLGSLLWGLRFVHHRTALKAQRVSSDDVDQRGAQRPTSRARDPGLRFRSSYRLRSFARSRSRSSDV